MCADVLPQIETIPESGTLTDAAIIELASRKQLITEHFSEACVKQACYELRASNTFYLPPKANTHSVAEGDFILLRPRELVVVITKEKLQIPADVVGRILTKGQLFSVGISAVNTYADPGFSGELGIVLCNNSVEYLKIRPGDPIAKIEFSRLDRPVSHPYKGQHGYQTKIWPIPVDSILGTDDVWELKKAGRIGSATVELERAFGKDFAKIYRRMFVLERRMFVGLGAYMLATIALIALGINDSLRSSFLNLALGAMGSIIATLITVKLDIGE